MLTMAVKGLAHDLLLDVLFTLLSLFQLQRLKALSHHNNYSFE